jgi:hypothetical protein
MNAIPTMPKPTTTILFRSDGGLGYLFPSFSSSVRAFGGSLLIAMPGDDVAQDIIYRQLPWSVVIGQQHSIRISMKARRRKQTRKKVLHKWEKTERTIAQQIAELATQRSLRGKVAMTTP